MHSASPGATATKRLTASPSLKSIRPAIVVPVPLAPLHHGVLRRELGVARGRRTDAAPHDRRVPARRDASYEQCDRKYPHVSLLESDTYLDPSSSARFTRGITSSAINSIERRASWGSAQSCPQ